MTSSISAIARFTPGRSEYARCPPSCITLKPMPAIARPSDTTASSTCHQVCAKKTSATHDAAHHARMIAVFRHMRPPPFGERCASAK